MREGYLSKFAVGILIVAVALVVLSGQSAHVAASTSTTSTPQTCYYYNNYNMTNYWWYYYYYGYYPYYYCNYNYYGYYYPYNSYYYYPYSYSYYGYNYYSTPSKYQLTVATDPANLATVTGGGSYTSGSSASFSVTQNVVQSSSNTRYVFSHWSGDYSGVGSSGTVTVNGAMKIIAVYQLQYYLSVNAQPQSVPTPQGAGWYNAGDTATVSSPGQTIAGDSQNRLLFQGWSVDGQNSQPAAALSVKMDTPHSVTALYTQQYYLKVLSDQGVAYGEGWYNAGDTAQVFASTPTSTSYGVSYVFNGWQGDLQSNSQSTSVVMDKAKTVVATWRTDSTVLYVTIALGIIAILLAAGIIGFSVRGRQTQTTYVQSPKPTQTSETHVKKKPVEPNTE